MPPDDDAWPDDVPDYPRWLKAFSGDDDDMLVGDRPGGGASSGTSGGASSQPVQKPVTSSTTVDYFSITRAIVSGRASW